MIVVNKADGSLLQAAQHTAAEYTHALHFQVCVQAGGGRRLRLSRLVRS